MRKPIIKIVGGKFNSTELIHIAPNGFKRKVVIAWFIPKDTQELMLCNFYKRVVKSLK